VPGAGPRPGHPLGRDPLAATAVHPADLGAATSTLVYGSCNGAAAARLSCDLRATSVGKGGQPGSSAGCRIRGDQGRTAQRPPCVSAGGRCSKPGERLGGQGGVEPTRRQPQRGFSRANLSTRSTISASSWQPDIIAGHDHDAELVPFRRSVPARSEPSGGPV
jgi:hypothetical protein